MAHTYASVSELQKLRTDGGSTETANDATFLSILEGASRAIDAFCDRSRFGSGFGPRTGTNRYNQTGRTLELDDDLLSLTSITTYDSVGGTSSTLTDETDVLKYPYDATPYRRLILHENSSNWWGTATRGNWIAGKWGYQDERRTATATAGSIGSTTATTFTIGGTDDLAIGMTLLIDSEQVYLRGKSGTTATIDRGVNGTIAATHSGGAAIAFYLYPEEVVSATLLVAMRRWKMRDAGLVANFGGGSMPDSAHQDSEWSILRSTVGHLRLYSAA